jgi:hypothetical protein
VLLLSSAPLFIQSRFFDLAHASFQLLVSLEAEAMNTQSMEHNTSLLLYVDENVDYGYEDHSPDPRYLENTDVAKPDVSSSCCTFRSPSDFSTNSLVTGTVHLGDATEVSQSPSHSMKNSWSRCAVTPNPNTVSGFTATMLDSEDDSEGEDSSDYDAVLAAAAMVGENGSDYHEHGEMTLDAYPPMPADRQARKQRSFHRRGGEVHGALLKSAVMASMSLDLEDSNDEDETIPGGPHRFRNVRRESCQSSISLQSLQDALRSETSPRKRARRGQRRASFDDDDDNLLETAYASTSTDTNHSRDMAEASDLFDTMRVGSGENRSLHRTSGGSNHLRLSGSSGHLRSSGSSHFRSSISSAGGAGDPSSVPSAVPKREPPPRRVSRKTSYDSRVSDYDSDFDPDDWDE